MSNGFADTIITYRPIRTRCVAVKRLRSKYRRTMAIMMINDDDDDDDDGDYDNAMCNY